MGRSTLAGVAAFMVSPASSRKPKKKNQKRNGRAHLGSGFPAEIYS